jgi:hypothetical protein
LPKDGRHCGWPDVADPFTPENESLLFAVLHLANMLTKLEKEYDARWHGEVRG